MKVLIVDDDEGIHGVLKGILEEYDFEVSSCFDGNDAVNIVLDEKPDLLFLDYVMPGLDGVKVMKAFQFACKDIKTIIISGHDIQMPRPEPVRVEGLAT